jgi:hypothetical protein
MLKSEMEIINFRNFPYFSKRNETEKLNFWEKNFYFPSLKHRKKKNEVDFENENEIFNKIGKNLFDPVDPEEVEKIFESFD